jgi:beta-glucanase (GH16 family)
VLDFRLRAIVSAPPVDPTKLVWSDEFDVDGLPDSSKWDYDLGGHGWGNQELQHYTDRSENAFVSDGILNIRAVREDYEDSSYTSARLITKFKGDWTYGRIQVRARLLQCRATGSWAAIWMLPTDWMYGGWPDSGEIDIMEHVGYDEGKVHGSVHTKAFNHMINTQSSDSIHTSVDEWHVYDILWDEEHIEFNFDGLKYHEFRKETSSTYKEWPFDQDFHLLLNVAVGGSWGGQEGVNASAFEGDGQIMEVDWVRIYSI